LDLYKDPWLSVVRFTQQLAATAGQTLNIPTPAFINLDAHQHIDEIPSGDFLCLSGWSRYMDGKMPTFHVSIGVSTYEDPDMLRHIDLMTLVAKATEPEKRVPLFDSSSANPTAPVGMLTIGGQPIIDPTEKGNVRTLQLCTIRLETTLTAGMQGP
jgi:hypothetical protein